MDNLDLRNDLQKVADKYGISDFIYFYCPDPQAIDFQSITVNKNPTNRAAELFRQLRRYIILYVKQKS